VLTFVLFDRYVGNVHFHGPPLGVELAGSRVERPRRSLLLVSDFVLARLGVLDLGDQFRLGVGLVVFDLELVGLVLELGLREVVEVVICNGYLPPFFIRDFAACATSEPTTEA
jgi:hypothetical protein